MSALKTKILADLETAQDKNKIEGLSNAVEAAKSKLTIAQNRSNLANNALLLASNTDTLRTILDASLGDFNKKAEDIFDNISHVNNVAGALKTSNATLKTTIDALNSENVVLNQMLKDSVDIVKTLNTDSEGFATFFSALLAGVEKTKGLPKLMTEQKDTIKTAFDLDIGTEKTAADTDLTTAQTAHDVAVKAQKENQDKIESLKEQLKVFS